VLRQFRKDTNEYTRIFSRVDMSVDLDPNNKTWYDKHNKMALHRFRTCAGDWRVKHTAWDNSELAVLHRKINADILKDGLDAFDSKFNKAFISAMTDKVNAVGGKARGVLSVATRLRRRKGPIFELLGRAQAMKARIQAGENVPKTERYPPEAIAIPAEGQGEGEAEDQDGDEEEGAEGANEEVGGDETQDHDKATGSLGDLSVEELQGIENDNVAEAKRRSLKAHDNVEDFADTDTDAVPRSHLRKGKRTHSHSEQQTEHKRPRTKAGDDIAMAEARARAQAPLEEESDDDEMFMRG